MKTFQILEISAKSTESWENKKNGLSFLRVENDFAVCEIK